MKIRMCLSESTDSEARVRPRSDITWRRPIIRTSTKFGKYLNLAAAPSGRPRTPDIDRIEWNVKGSDQTSIDGLWHHVFGSMGPSVEPPPFRCKTQLLIKSFESTRIRTSLRLSGFREAHISRRRSLRIKKQGNFIGSQRFIRDMVCRRGRSVGTFNGDWGAPGTPGIRCSESRPRGTFDWKPATNSGHRDGKRPTSAPKAGRKGPRSDQGGEWPEAQRRCCDSQHNRSRRWRVGAQVV
jgi:hypothetical protein